MVYYFVTDMKHRTHTNSPSSNLLQKSVNILRQHQGFNSRDIHSGWESVTCATGSP